MAALSADKCLFLSIPAELRIRIYEHVLATPTVLGVSPHCTFETSTPTALPWPNRQFRKEFEDVAKKKQQVFLHINERSMPTLLHGKPVLKALRSVLYPIPPNLLVNARYLTIQLDERLNIHFSSRLRLIGAIRRLLGRFVNIISIDLHMPEIARFGELSLWTETCLERPRSVEEITWVAVHQDDLRVTDVISKVNGTWQWDRKPLVNGDIPLSGVQGVFDAWVRRHVQAIIVRANSGTSQAMNWV